MKIEKYLYAQANNMSLRKLYYILPVGARYFARQLWYAPVDFLDRMTGKRNALAPPRGMIFTGPGDFIKEGEVLLEQFKTLAELKANARVLDIGAGIGRSAVALTSYLSKEAKYLGFDPVATGIKWCQKNISPKFSNFEFRYIPLQNDLYQESGGQASEFTFPFEKESWDFVILTSVFTHMQPKEIAHYLSEIKGMLSTTGKVFATFFILDERKISNEKFTFPFEKEGYRLMDQKVQAANVALESTFLEKMISDAGLKISKKQNGFWTTGKRNAFGNFQDILILERAN